VEGVQLRIVIKEIRKRSLQFFFVMFGFVKYDLFYTFFFTNFFKKIKSLFVFKINFNFFGNLLFLNLYLKNKLFIYLFYYFYFIIFIFNKQKKFFYVYLFIFYKYYRIRFIYIYNLLNLDIFFKFFNIFFYNIKRFYYLFIINFFFLADKLVYLVFFVIFIYFLNLFDFNFFFLIDFIIFIKQIFIERIGILLYFDFFSYLNIKLDLYIYNHVPCYLASFNNFYKNFLYYQTLRSIIKERPLFLLLHVRPRHIK
jgi:hypothetical protein